MIQQIEAILQDPYERESLTELAADFKEAMSFSDGIEVIPYNRVDEIF